MYNLILDGDIIAYKATFAAETPINWGKGLWTLHAWEEDVKMIIDEMIGNLYNTIQFMSYQVALTGKENFRKNIDSTYKANRAKTRKPMLLDFARDYLMKNHNGYTVKNIEADDILGLLGTSDPNYVIWSEDKDMGSLPCKQLNKEGVVYSVSEAEADYNFFTQVLTGDSTDNYGGCPKIGKVTAEKILNKAKAEGVPYWPVVLEAYIKAGKTEEYALSQARLARILRCGEYNFKNNEVVLWTPTTMW